MFSEVTIQFLVDFEIDYQCSLSTQINNLPITIYQWTWVNTRVSPFEVTAGTPTANPGETTAINFAAAFALDLPVGYTISVQNTNEVLIQSTTSGETFAGFKASDENDFPLLGTGFLVNFNNFIPPVDTSNIDLALVRSPHYVNIPFNFDTTISATIDITVWDGDLALVPSTPTYSITAVRPTTDFQEFNIDLSKIIDESLDPRPDISVLSAVDIVNSERNNLKWTQYVATYSDPEESIPNIEGTLSACEGYGLYSDGVNPTRPTNRWLSNVFSRRVNIGQVILIPFVNDGTITSITVQSFPNGDLNTVLNPITSNESEEFVQYVQIDSSNIIDDTSITITDNSNTIFTVEIINECRFQPKLVIFKNRFGHFESITFFKKSNESYQVDKDQFVNNYIANGTYDTTLHQIKDINIQATESIVCNSGYINESENELYKQMLSSDQVFFYESDFIPIRPVTSNIEFRTRVNDGLVNYQINFEYAYNSIQNI